MQTASALVQLIGNRIQYFLQHAADDVNRISPDAAELNPATAALLTRGKRLRPQFCYWGWRAVGDALPDSVIAQSDPDIELESILDICVGLEFFHAAALVHDDIIDNSATRRGAPSQHVAFARLHDENSWSGSSAEFGRAAAILVGDLLLASSNECFQAALARRLPADRSDRVRQRIADMQRQVMVGQYLDVREEHAWRSRDPEQAERAARTILTYKSARYSVESPLMIGASVAGATVGQIDALSRFGLAIGQAFQLRDDVLGVFGDPELTGKPAGDDLREGKRTLLIIRARKQLAPATARIADEMLGDPDLEPEQIDFLRRAITESGALESIEQEISRLRATALSALADGELGNEARGQLIELATAATSRVV